MKKLLPLLFFLSFILAATAQQVPVILPLKERAVLEDQLLQARLDELLPTLMRKNGIDMWLVIAREYNEDPIIKTMLPKPEFETTESCTSSFLIKFKNKQPAHLPSSSRASC